MERYIYDGPVMIFNTCVATRWKGETMAVSENKARSNLSFQFKKYNNQLPGARVTLPGKIMKG